MCGIAGAIGNLDPEVREATRLRDAALAHRGPDAAGSWSSHSGNGRLWFRPEPEPNLPSTREAGFSRRYDLSAPTRNERCRRPKSGEFDRAFV